MTIFFTTTVCHQCFIKSTNILINLQQRVSLLVLRHAFIQCRVSCSTYIFTIIVVQLEIVIKKYLLCIFIYHKNLSF